MSRFDKVRSRFMSLPSDFSWQELQKLLTGLSYRESQGGRSSGSRVRFIHDHHPPIMLHKPHPKPYLKRYQMQQMYAALKERGQL